jgi:RNA polymerase sigma factor (sigma-70 family)
MQLSLAPTAARSDSELMTSIIAGDTAAFEEIYHRYHARVFAIARKLLGDDHAAEDIVQSVFLTIWRSARLFRGGAFDAWIATVTINRARSALRARASAGGRLQALGAEPSTERPFTDELFARFEALRVYELLERLPDRQRALIKLGFFEHRTHAEIAHMMDLPLGTVKTRMRAGLTRLRSDLQPGAFTP